MAQIAPSVGIDVSEGLLDVASYPDDERRSVSNDAAGRRDLCRWLRPMGVRAIGIEASGGYERGVIGALLDAGLPVRSVNPWRLRQFARAAGVLAKNDRLDAAVIAWFVVTLPCRAVQRDRDREHLAELVGARRQLAALQQVLRNQLAHVRDGELRRLHVRRLRQIEADVLRLESRMVAAIAAVPAMAAGYALLCSMPGVGRVLAATLLAWLPELGSISHRQIGGLVGVVPYAWDSGKLKGLRRIFGGRGDVRGVLYMAGRSGAQHNPVLKALYGRLLTAGKPPMVAIVAVMRKMLVSLNAMVRDNQSWQGPMEASAAK